MTSVQNWVVQIGNEEGKSSGTNRRKWVRQTHRLMVETRKKRQHGAVEMLQGFVLR